MEKSKDIILISGQSGININKCLNKIDRIISNCYNVSIDRRMSEILEEDFLEILACPPRILFEKWGLTFDTITKEINREDSNYDYKIVNFHASYFHQSKRQFISPVDFSRLYNWKFKDRIKMIIVFIDDCYDVYRRLMCEDEMFYYVKKFLNEGEALFHSISNLITVLHWREIEMAFSQKISQLLDIPLYIFAVKHTCFMLKRLITLPLSELKIKYLSHPISSIRKEKFSRTQDFIVELNEFTKDILKKYQNSVIFIPDTIDEKRIQSANGKYIPSLINPWPLPFSEEEWVFSALPDEVVNINPLNPKDYKNVSMEYAISESLKILAKRIDDQINSRDISLVEQGIDGLIVYRPCWEGYTAKGVNAEVNSNSFLRDRSNYRNEDRTVDIILLDLDIGKSRIRKLFNLIINDIKDCNKEKLEKLCKEWVKDMEIVKEFYRKSWNQKEIKKSVEKFLPADYKFNLEDTGTLGSAEYLKIKEAKDNYWEKLFIELQKDEFVSKFDKNKDSQLLIGNEERHEIASKASEFIINKLKERSFNNERIH